MKTEVQRGKVTCLGVSSMAESGPRHRLLCPIAHFLPYMLHIVVLVNKGKL